MSIKLERSLVSHDHCSYERNLGNCAEKPEKVRTSTRFEPMRPLERSLFVEVGTN